MDETSVTMQFPTQELAERFVRWLAGEGQDAWMNFDDSLPGDTSIKPRFDFKNLIVRFELRQTDD